MSSTAKNNKKKGKKAKSKKPKGTRFPETPIEVEIRELTMEDAKDEAESRLDYLCRLSVAVLSLNEEEAEALGEQALAWCREFDKSETVIEPSKFMEQWAKDHPEPEPEPDGEVEIEESKEPTPPPAGSKAKLQLKRPRRTRVKSAMNEGKPDPPDHLNATREFRRHIIHNQGLRFGECWDLFQYGITERTARTLFYQTRGVLEVLMEEQLLLSEKPKK